MTETELAQLPDIPASPAHGRIRRRVGLATVGMVAVAAGAAFAVHQATQPPSDSGQRSASQETQLPAAFVPPDRRATVGGSSGGVGTLSAATSAQQVGIVEIDTVLAYQNARAAGTGMILTSTGEILTNNHVVDGATRISVTISSTGASYSATVVGTDSTDDVAVLQLADASGLQIADLSRAVAGVGEAVTGVGNAGGTGSLTAATGTIASLDQMITASDETGGTTEQLAGLIETDAAIRSGDSGGPLYGSDGAVIGMDTAASSGSAMRSYAIPIETAQAIAAQIEAGVDDATIHQGYPPFLGVSLQDSAAGATVTGVVSGGPAAGIGITAGDVIGSTGGSPVTSAATLRSAMAGHHPGDRVAVRWTTATGAARSATVTLTTGPAA